LQFTRGMSILLLVAFTGLPLMAAYLSNPSTFNAGWNEGKGSLVFAMVFLVIEAMDASFSVSMRKIVLALTMALVVSCIFFLDPQPYRPLLDMGSYFGVKPELTNYSWHEFWVTLTFFLSTLTIVIFMAGLKQLRTFAFTSTYLVLTAIVLFADALFPYDQLGALQSVVPFLVSVATSVAQSLHLVNMTSFGNTMLVDSGGTPKALIVFWPSAGVHSVLIFTGIAVAFLLKRRITGFKFLTYAFLGAIGTVCVNIIRIVLLVYCTAYYPPEYFQGFHNVVGETLFIPWLVVFMLIVHYIEMYLRNTHKST